MDINIENITSVNFVNINQVKSTYNDNAYS